MIFCALLINLITYLNNVNFLINEIHEVSYLSVEETMDHEMEYLSAENRDKYENFDIEESFKDTFNSLVDEPDNYVLSVKGDREHGILKVNAKCLYSEMVKDVSLLNIIEDNMEINEGSGIDSFVIEDVNDTRSDHDLYEREFDETVTLKSFYIDIEAYSESNGDIVQNRYEPEMTITIIDEDDNEITFDKPAVKGKKTKEEVNFDSDNYDFEEMKVKYVKLEMKGISSSKAPKAEILRIGSTGKCYFEYDGAKETSHSLYSRYIDKSYLPEEDSIWLNDEYQSVLKEYLNNA